MVMNQKKTNIVIVGLGYVGLPLALLAQEKGYHVQGIVKNPEKAKHISNGIAPFRDKEIQRKLKLHPIPTYTDFSVIKKADIVIMCIPTPVHEDFSPDLEPVISATKNIARYVKKNQLVILESTVNPGTVDDVVIPILEKISGLSVGKKLMVAHCPERINPGDKLWNVANIPRVVGASDAKALKHSVTFYRSLIASPITPMGSIKEAEACKIVENCFRDINIAFVNELAMSFKRMDIDILHVLEGASTKPFAFLPHYPGCGVGGHCIPVDPYYLIAHAEKNGFIHKLLKTARSINNGMPQYTVDLLLQLLEKNKIKISNVTVGILGVAYKANIDDARESPSFDIKKLLNKQQIKTVIYDPYVPKFSTVNSLDQLLRESNAIILVTDHKEFTKITPALLTRYGIYGIVDGKNCLQKEAFVKAKFPYTGIGR
jgi:UDP-N-acetyl-D-glucosamine dehydrogenase